MFTYQKISCLLFIHNLTALNTCKFHKIITIFDTLSTILIFPSVKTLTFKWFAMTFTFLISNFEFVCRKKNKRSCSQAIQNCHFCSNSSSYFINYINISFLWKLQFLKWYMKVMISGQKYFLNNILLIWLIKKIRASLDTSNPVHCWTVTAGLLWRHIGQFLEFDFPQV